VRYLVALCLLAACTPAADGVAEQAVRSAHEGDLYVYGATPFDGGDWRRGVLRGSVCAEERAMRAKRWSFEAGLPSCVGDGGEP